MPDLPEALVTGRERLYIKHFEDRLTNNPAATSPHDLEVYTLAYSQPGALRAAFNTYRAFEKDAEINQGWLKEFGKCKVRCMLLSGDKSFLSPNVATEMVNEFYEDVRRIERVSESGHYMAEERPAEYVQRVLSWIEEK